MHNRFNYLRVIRDCLLRVISLDSVFFVFFLCARHPSRLTPDVEKCSLNISTFLPDCLFLSENSERSEKNCKKKQTERALVLATTSLRISNSAFHIEFESGHIVSFVLATVRSAWIFLSPRSRRISSALFLVRYKKYTGVRALT